MDPIQWPLIASLPETNALAIEVTYRMGTRSSKNHLPLLNPILVPALRCTAFSVFAGSLNLHADEGIRLPSPARATLRGNTWHFVPVVLQSTEVGVVARRADSGDIRFLEVFACRELVPVLNLEPEKRVSIQLLPGRFLDLAA